jgi:hypothetical protein
MSGICNCYHLRFDEEAGRTKFTGTIQSLPPRSSNWFNTVPFTSRNRDWRLMDQTNPRGTGEQAVIAVAGYDRDQHAFVSRSPDFTLTLLLINSHERISLGELYKRTLPNPVVQNARLWVGGSPGRQLEREGQGTDPRKSQLFGIEEGESVLYIDGRRQIWAITAQAFGTPPKLRLASRSEIAQWAYQDGKIRGRNDRDAREWARRVIAETGCAVVLANYAALYPSNR